MPFSSVRFSRSVVSDSLWCHESQHPRPPCPSPTPRVYANSLPSSQWCHPAISSSVVPFSSCPQSLPTSGSFPMTQFFTCGSQRIEVSALASVLPMKKMKFLLFWQGIWFFQWSCMDVRVELWKKLSTEELMLLNCGVGEDSWEALRLQGDPTIPS